MNKYSKLAASPYKDDIIAVLKEVQDYVADVRNGDYNLDTRKQTVEVIEKELINKIVLPNQIQEDEVSYK